MIKNYIKIAWRNLIKNKFSSLINIGGLAVGMAVAMLIGLWIWDELAFDKYHQNYDRIAQVMENQTLDHDIATLAAKPIPLANELRLKYGNDFKAVAAATFGDQVIAFGDNSINRNGAFVEATFPSMMTLKMVQGSRESLKDPSSIIISQSLANILFGNSEPMNKMVKLGNNYLLKVAGIYEDLPKNTTFKDVAFLVPVDLIVSHGSGSNVQGQFFHDDDWRSSSFEIYVQLNPSSDFAGVSAKIKNVLYANNHDATKPALFLYPMSRWHLYSEFKNGVNEGGRIQFVWLFGIIGVFVLLLACINFMNLSTARSEKRAKEVGIRKAIGSVRSQLISQFFSESFLIVACAFVLSLVMVQLILPFFNDVADKHVTILWTNPLFWIMCLTFSLFTGFIAGSYPAFYLSSFQPVKVLKGTFKAGRYASIPRKVLVVLQFTVSVILIIGTIGVFRQIQFAKDRPIGYNRDGLITVDLNNDLQNHYEALRNSLMKTGMVTNVSISSSPTTGVWSSANNLEWKGKEPGRQLLFGTVSASSDFGKTIGWKLKEGRDFSSQFVSDSLAFIFNEAAIEQMGLKNPVGEFIKWHGKNFKVIGVVKNMVMTSPFDPASPTVFMMNKERSLNVIVLKLAPTVGIQQALEQLKAVFKTYNPNAPFDYKLADQEYAMKFANEVRIGKLAAFFTILAIFISCLGLFGIASFVAEQRIKEIGVRKVLGASVFNLWQLLSIDFALLVLIALVIASPIAYYLMNNWLQKYQYHSNLEWWVFAVTGLGAMVLTLATVSFQSIKAALVNPVKSLKTE